MEGKEGKMNGGGGGGDLVARMETNLRMEGMHVRYKGDAEERQRMRGREREAEKGILSQRHRIRDTVNERDTMESHQFIL